jgi:hypothetical protein
MVNLAAPPNQTRSDIGFFEQNALLNQASNTPEQVLLAARYLTKHAPDLTEAIFGVAA